MTNARTAYRFGRFTLDLERGCLEDGRNDLELRPKSFQVLRCLVENAGRLMTKDELVRAVWPNVVVSDGSLAHCIRDIRRTLHDEGGRFVKTVPRRGYTFLPEVVAIDSRDRSGKEPAEIAGAGEQVRGTAAHARANSRNPTVAELAALPVCATLSAEELQAFAQCFVVRVFPKGAIVALEGERQDMFNFILSGRIKWFWRDESGRHLDVAVNGPGEHFADSTFGGEPILTSVIALEDLRLASIPLPEFERLLLAYPQFAVAYLKRVVARLRRNIEQMRTFSMEDVYGRVVSLFLARAVEIDGTPMTERLTHAEIGLRIGATREMVGQVLRELARGGYIRSDKGRIAILNWPPATRKATQ